MDFIKNHDFYNKNVKIIIFIVITKKKKNL